MFNILQRFKIKELMTTKAQPQFIPPPNTNDAWYLQQYHWQKVFICDEMSSGHPKNRLLGPDAQKIGSAFTEANDFLQWKMDLGRESFSIPLDYDLSITKSVAAVKSRRERYYTPGRIRGDLFAVRPDVLISLDSHRENGVQFERKRVNLVIPHLRAVRENGHTFYKPFTKTIRAWMYLGNLDYWKPILDSSFNIKPVRQFVAAKTAERYYMFTPLEYSSPPFDK